MSDEKKDIEFLKAVGTALVLIAFASFMWGSLASALVYGLGLEVKSWPWLVGGLIAYAVLSSLNKTILKAMGWR